MLKNILTILGAIVGIFFYGFLKGKKSTQEKENDIILKQVEKRNETIDKVNHLSDDELEPLVQKFTKTNK